MQGLKRWPSGLWTMASLERLAWLHHKCSSVAPAPLGICLGVAHRHPAQLWPGSEHQLQQRLVGTRKVKNTKFEH